MAEQSVGQVSLDLVLNSKQFKQQLTSSVDNAVKKATSSAKSTVASSFGKLGAVAAAAFSLKAVFDFSKSAIQLGSDLSEVQNVVEVAFGEMSGEADKFAKNALRNFGIGETSAKRMMGTYGAMASSFGYTNKEALDMAETLTGLTGDVSSFYNLSNEMSYTKLKSVFTGETESLKELGVVMTQTALDEFALANGFGKTTSAMTEQEKVALRLAFVQNSLKKASGDFSRTANSWANQTRILSESWNSFKAQLGQAFIQALTPVIQGLNQLLAKMIQVATVFNQFTAKLFGKQDTGGITQVSDDMSELANNTAGVGDAAAGTAKKIKKSLMSFDQLHKLDDNSDSGAGGAGGIGSAIDNMKSAQEVSKEAQNQIDKIAQKINELKNSFKTGFNATFDATGFIQAEQHSKNILDNLKQIATDPEVQAAGNKFANVFSENLGKITGATATLGGNLAANITGGFDKALADKKDLIKQTMIDTFDFESIKMELRGQAADAVANISGVFRSESAKGITAAIDGIIMDIGLYSLRIYERLSADINMLLLQPLIDNQEKIKNDLQKVSDGLEPIFVDIEDFTNNALQEFVDMYDAHIHPMFQEITESLSEIQGLNLDIFGLLLDKYMPGITSWFSDFTENHLKPLWTDLMTLFGDIAEQNAILTEKLTPIIEVINTIGAAVGSVIADIILPLIGNVITTVTDVVDGFIQIISGSIETVISLLKGDFMGAFRGIIKQAGGVMQQLASIVDGVINTCVDAINNFFNTNFSHSNLVSMVKNLVSKVMGALGGDDDSKEAEKQKKKGGAAVAKMNKPKTFKGPKLATGGYVAANSPQLAMIGDNKREGEIVAPESKIAEAVAAGMKAAMTGFISMQAATATGSTEGDIIIPIYLDGNEFDRVIVNAQERRNARTGGKN